MIRSLLREEDCARIHAASLKILETVGVRVDDEAVVKLLLGHGADATAARDVVRLPRGLVADCLAACPSSARVADRRGGSREFGVQGGTVFWTGNALYIARGSAREELKTADLAQLTRVAEACPEIDGMVGTSVADYPPPARDVVGFREMARNTAKHLRPCIFTPAGATAIVEMGQVLADGAALRERPVVSFGYSIVSPLHWTPQGIGVIRNTAGHGLPLMINSEPMGGGTAPVTLAGCLALANADTLSGIVIAQLVERGRPVIYNVGFAHVLDMATGVALTGAPENALLQSAGAELARFHRMPSASWMSTESMVADAQAGAESLMTGFAHALWGVNVIWGAGNLESTLCMSPEKLLLDDELIGAIRRFARGIPVNEETLALELILELGHRADFLSSEHTLEHFREAIRHSPLMARSRRQAWARAGSLDTAARAKARVEEILARPARGQLSAEQERELTRIVERHLASIGA